MDIRNKKKRRRAFISATSNREFPPCFLNLKIFVNLTLEEKKKYLDALIIEYNLDTVDGTNIFFDNDLQTLLDESNIKELATTYLHSLERDIDENLINFKEGDFIGGCLFVQNQEIYLVKFYAKDNMCNISLAYDFINIQPLN